MDKNVPFLFENSKAIHNCTFTVKWENFVIKIIQKNQ